MLQNKGDAPLLIDRVETECSCTRVHHDDIIKPGNNAYFRVTLNTAGQTGAWTKTIRVFSNDPMQPEVRLSIKANVLKAVSVTPDRVFFNGTVGTALDQVVTITSPDGSPFSLALKQSQLPDQVGFYIEPKANQYRVHIRNKAQHAETARGRIFLTTDIPHRPLITLPVLSRIQDVFTLFPSTIDFGHIKKSSHPNASHRNITRSINLKYKRNHLPEIVSIKIDPKKFQTQITPIKDMGILRIDVIADIDQFGQGTYKTQLELEINTEGTRTYSIPVEMTVY